MTQTLFFCVYVMFFVKPIGFKSFPSKKKIQSKPSPTVKTLHFVSKNLLFEITMKYNLKEKHKVHSYNL